jgi:hypothetical protein
MSDLKTDGLTASEYLDLIGVLAGYKANIERWLDDFACTVDGEDTLSQVLYSQTVQQRDTIETLLDRVRELFQQR